MLPAPIHSGGALNRAEPDKPVAAIKHCRRSQAKPEKIEISRSPQALTAICKESEINFDVCKGDVFRVMMAGPVFASARSEEITGMLTVGSDVVAAGPLHGSRKAGMLPILPEGAVEMCLLSKCAAQSKPMSVQLVPRHEPRTAKRAREPNPALIRHAQADADRGTSERQPEPECIPELSLTVTTKLGKARTVTVQATASVADLRRSVVEVCPIPLSLVHLSFQGRSLQDGKTMSDYGITDGASLLLTSKSIVQGPECEQAQATLSIKVQTKMGREMPVQVRAEASVEEMRKAVAETTRIPLALVQLVFQGSRLEDTDALGQHGICEGSLLLVGGVGFEKASSEGF